MASIIPGYNYDIFISYRQKDNKGDHWVSNFAESLKTELESTFKEEISVYFDINPHDGLLETHDVDASLKEKLQCLIFIPIISRTYCDPKSFAWEHEFKAFVEMASKDQLGLKVKLPNGNVASRVLPVRIHELDRKDIDACESILGGYLRGVEFVYREAGIDKPLSAEDDEKKNLNKTRYNLQVIKVAHSVRDLVEGIKLVHEMVATISDGDAEKSPGRELRKNMSESDGDKPRRKKLIGIAGTLTLIIIASMLLYPKLIRSDKFKSLRDSKGMISIAVLPFENLTGDTTLSYFGRGISSLIINGLGNSSELSVCDDATLSEAMDGAEILNTAGISPAQAMAISKKVNAEAYVSGSFQGVQDKYLVILNLVSSATGKILWTDKTEGNIRSSEYRVIADSLCKRIRNYLEIKALEKNADFEFSEAYPKSAEAYRYFIEGMNLVLKNDYKNGIEYLKRSLRIDSTAIAGFYLTYAYNYSNKFDSGLVNLQKIYPLRRNIPLKYQTWMDMWYACYFGNSIQDITKYCDMLAESGINTRLFWFDLGVTYHDFSRQYDKSADAFRKVLEISKARGTDWKFVSFYAFYGHDLHMLGRHEEEQKIYDEGLEIFPDNRSILRRQSACYLSKGDTAGANNAIRKIKLNLTRSDLPVYMFETNLASIYSSAGFPLKAEPHAKKALELSPLDNNYIYMLASILIDSDVNVDEGMKFVASVLDTLPETAGIYRDMRILLGVAKYKKGQYGEAVDIMSGEWYKKGLPDVNLYHYFSEAKHALAKQQRAM